MILLEYQLRILQNLTEKGLRLCLLFSLFFIFCFQNKSINKLSKTKYSSKHNTIYTFTSY
jgi:hypothetical protein